MDDRVFDDAWLLGDGSSCRYRFVGGSIGDCLGLLRLPSLLSSWLRVLILGLCNGVLSSGRLYALPRHLRRRILLYGLIKPFDFWTNISGLLAACSSHSDDVFSKFKLQIKQSILFGLN